MQRLGQLVYVGYCENKTASTVDQNSAPVKTFPADFLG